MKSAHRAAGDGDETERENLPGEDRPGAVCESRQRGHLERGPHHQHAGGEREDRRDLYEGAQVVARSQQQPDGERGSRKSVDDDGDRKRRARKRECVRPGGRRVHPLAGYHREADQRDAPKRRLEHASRPQESQVDSHQQRDGNRHCQRERAPGRIPQRFYDHERDHRQQNHHDRQHGETCDGAAPFGHFLARDLPQGFPVAPHRAEQNREILHAAAQRRADDQPERPRQVAELRRERGPDQWSRAGDGREMMAQQHPFIRGDEITAVLEPLGRSGARVVQRKYLRGNERGIKPIGDQIRTQRGDDEPDGVERLAAFKGNRRERAGTSQRDASPNHNSQDSLHSGLEIDEAAAEFGFA